MLLLGLLRPGNECGEFFRHQERVHLRDEEEELFPLLLRQRPVAACSAPRGTRPTLQFEGFARTLDIAVAAGIIDRETLDVAGELLTRTSGLRSDSSFR